MVDPGEKIAKRGKYSKKLSPKKSGLIDRDLPLNVSDVARDKLDEQLFGRKERILKPSRLKITGDYITKISVKTPLPQRDRPKKNVIRGLINGNGFTNGLMHGLTNGNGLTNGIMRGLVNGNGLTNGIRRGLTNGAGTTRDLTLHKPSGLVNGNGITNGFRF